MPPPGMYPGQAPDPPQLAELSATGAGYVAEPRVLHLGATRSPGCRWRESGPGSSSVLLSTRRVSRSNWHESVLPANPQASGPVNRSDQRVLLDVDTLRALMLTDCWQNVSTSGTKSALVDLPKRAGSLPVAARSQAARQPTTHPNA